MRKKFVAAIGVGFGLSVNAVAALAEDAGAKAGPARTAVAADAQLEEVIVTARRREESLQAVPISVTALSGEALINKGITDAFALTDHVPSLRLQASELSPRLFTTSIRGLKSLNYLILDDSPIGTYFAEGVVGHPYGFGASFYDIQSVQVLKGPQGTLFGRNTTGGAVLVEPNKASIDEGFDGNAKVSVGDYNMRKFEGAVNVPLNDVAAFRIAGAVHERDGYTKNDLTGQKFDGIRTESLRLSLLLKPSTNLSSHTILDYLKDDGSPNAGILSRVYPGGGSSFNSALVGNNSTANALALLAAQQARGPRHAAIVLGTNSPFDYFSPANCVGNRKCRDGMPSQEVLNWGFLNNTEYEFNPDLHLKNILSYRYAKEMTTGNNYSPGALTAIGTQSNLADDVSQWSEEFQLSGKALDGKLDWATGLFTMREWGKDRTYTASFTAAAPVQQVPGLGSGPWNANWTGSWGDGETRSDGIYAQGTYQLAERLKGTLGIRHNRDQKHAVDSSPSLNGTGCFIAVADRDVPTACRMSDSKEYEANTYTMSLEYQWTDQTLLYLAHRKGYKSGGYSLRIHSRPKFAYAPEYATDYEAGIKSDWKLAGMPVRTNLALYQTKLTDMQVQVSNAATTPVSTYTDNVGRGQVRGYEFEVSLLPTERWEVSGFVSYTNPKVLEYKAPAPSVPGGFLDLSWRNVIGNGMPKWQGGLSTKYTLPLDAGSSLALLADISLRSATVTSNQYPVSYTGPNSQFLTAAQRTSFAFVQPTQAGFGVLNLRADWKHPLGSPVNLGFFVTNAGDVVYKQGCNASGGAETCNYAPPRMFGMELSYKFGEGFKAAN